jgi:predicted anti-sigma-YlaC factor YlaD
LEIIYLAELKMKRIIRFLLGLSCIFVLQSCSINKMAIKSVSDALTGSGSADVFTADSDPELVGDALPFAIKLYETLLSKNPNHQGLLLTTGSLFVMYANAFVQNQAEMLDPVYDYYERVEGLDRAKKLYLRGNALLETALDKKYPGFASSSVQDGSMDGFLKKCKKEDVPLLYWAVAGGLAAYSIDLFDFDLSSRIPDWGAMIGKAYELDPDFNEGAIDDFYILYYSALPDYLGGDKAKAEIHFRRALEKSRYLSAGSYVSYVQAVCVPAQDYDGFRENLEKALAIDPDENPSSRLINILSQRKARFLLDTADEYFSFLPQEGLF